MDAVETQETSFSEEAGDTLEAGENPEQKNEKNKVSDGARSERENPRGTSVDPMGASQCASSSKSAIQHLHEVPKGSSYSDNEISNVVLSTNSDNSHDSLKVSWKILSSTAEKYKVKIFNHKNTKLRSFKIKHPNHEATIDKLDPATTYYCTVLAKYADGREGKPVKSNSDKTADLPKELFTAREIEATKSAETPSRQISVRWKKPKYKGQKLDITSYQVYLAHDDNKKTEVQSILGKYECVFNHLKSNTAYTAHVTSITQAGDEVTASSHASTITDKAKGKPGFDIETDGKVTIIKCEAVLKHEPPTAMLDWKLPDLGIDKLNYELGAVQVFIATVGSEKIECHVIDKCKIKPVQVELGKLYTFTIECNYTDIDECKKITTTTKKELQTTIQSPVIEQIDFNKNIVVKWRKGHGAKEHNLKILLLNKMIWSTTTLSQNEHRIEIPVKEIKGNYYGRLCCFRLEATGANGAIKATEKKILFGGSSVVRDVIAIAGNRSVVVNWKPPDEFPNGYMVELFETTVKPTCQSHSIKDPSITTHTFTDLKSSTEYFCRLQPVFNVKKIVNATMSDTVQTAKRISDAKENYVDFGKATKLSHKFTSEDEILLSWCAPDLGPNFKIECYDVRLVQQVNLLPDKPLLAKKLNPSNLEALHKGISDGSKYTFKVTPLYKDLDSGENKTNVATHIFTKRPNSTTIKDCICKDGLVTFTWKQVTGATKYELQIMDQDQQIDLVAKQTTTVSKNNDGCSIELQSDDQLRIGRYCVARVTVCGMGDEKSQPTSKHIFIGGRKVVKNVTATLNKADPRRSVDIAFDRPQQEAAAYEYRVVAIASDDKKKTQIVNSTHVTFGFLKKGFSYHFEVSAKWDEEWSEASRSNSVKTAGNADTSLLNVGSLTQGDINLQNINVQGSNSLNVYKSNIGQIRDLHHTSKKDHGKDTITLTWKGPNFGANISDYKVELYTVEVFKNNAKIICDDTTETEYTTDLEWGEVYEIAVCTIYEYIDLSKYLMSNASELKISTTPCKPEFTKNTASNGELHLEWNSVQGAGCYRLELYVDKKKVIVKDLTIKDTRFQRPFDETLGYGKMFSAVLKAFGKDKKTFSDTETDSFLIGGKYAPTNVLATSTGVTDPSSQVIVRWTSAEIEPVGYDVQVWLTKVATDYKQRMQKGTECLISGLKTGTEYYFKVIANHSNGGCAVGSFSNMVKTSPAPTQVKNVKMYHGENRATSIKVHWDRVDRGESTEKVHYKLLLTEGHVTDENKEVVVSSKKPEFIFNYLEPNTSYEVMVKACNTFGSGRYSEKEQWTTEVGNPKDVKLSCDPGMPIHQLVLSFSNAEGKVLHYLATLFKYQNGAEIKVGKKKVIEKSPFTYTQLNGNTEYFVEICAEADTDAKGMLVKSNACRTAPNKPTIKEIKRLDHQAILAEWKSDRGCDSHEVTITCRDQIECHLVVYKEQLKYFCLNEGARYYVQVRSKNSSGHFGEASDQILINLEPRALRGASVELDGNKIRVACIKPMQTEYSYFMTVSCGEGNDKRTCKGEVEEDIIQWIYTPDKYACEYTFDVWAKSMHGVDGRRVTTNPIMSRPMKAELVLVKHVTGSPSTDIEISWKKQPQCNLYEVQMCNVNQTVPETVLKVLGRTSVVYKCLSPGNTYFVSVRAICRSTYGDWSENQSITLAPVKVQIKEKPSLDEIEIVKSIYIEWNPLDITPQQYHLQLYCDGEETGDPVVKLPTDEMHHIYEEQLKHGSLCYFTVKAFNGGQYGKPSSSKMYRIEWARLLYFIVKHDENDPKSKAIIKWASPHGVSRVRLEIQNHRTGNIIIKELPSSQAKYNFDMAEPGNTYTIKLYCGCDEKYSVDFSEETITMKPNPPNNVTVVAADNVKGLNIEGLDTDSANSSYEICLWSQMYPQFKYIKTVSNNKIWTLRDLAPGAKYEISVTTVIDDMKSEAAEFKCFTYPQKVENLHAIYVNDKIKFEWDQPEVKPDKYVVEWMENNGQAKKDSTEMTSFMIDHRKAAAVYSLRVAACNPSGCGEMTAWKNYRADHEPPIDICVKPSKGSHGLIISYKDNASPEKKYEIILESQSNQSFIQETTKEQQITMPNLPTPGDAYRVYVATVIGDIKSKPAVSDGYITIFPGKVEGLHSKIADEHIVFDWNPTQIKPDQYIVQWKVGSGPTEEETLEEPPFRIRSYKPAQLYSVRVMCLNEAGRGPTSAWVTFTTDPNPPSDICVQPCKASNGLIISYTDAASSDKKYEITLESQTTQEKLTPETTTELCMTVANLTPGDAYKVSVMTVIGNKRSKAAVSTSYIATFPEKVEGLRSTFVEGCIEFHWDSPQIKPDQYIVQSKVGYGAIIEEIMEEPPFRITSYKSAQVYAVRVMGLNEAGRGPMTKWELFTTEPDPPNMICITPSKTAKGLVIEYKDDASPEKMYELILESQNNPESVTKETTTELRITMPNLTLGDAYRVSVRTVIGDKRSKATVSDGYIATFPGKVKGLHSTFVDGCIEFNWDSPHIKPDQYIVQWKVNNEPIVEETMEYPPFKICRYKTAQVYAVRVMCLNEAGRGPMTTWEMFTTEPDPPSGICITPSKTSKGLIIEYKDDASPEKMYEVILESKNNPESVTKKTTTELRITMPNLTLGDAYRVSVRTLLGDKRSKAIVSDGYIATFPSKVESLRSTFVGDCIVFDWDSPQIKPDQYIVQCKVGNGAIVEETLDKPPFRICGSKSAQVYAVRVMCLNAAGRGPMTSWETFKTGPDAPNDICVKANKASNGLNISYKDDASPEKKYEITLESQQDPEIVIHQTTVHRYIIVPNLTPGDAYRVSVTTVIGDIKSKTAVSDGYTATFPGKVEGLHTTFADGNIEFKWELPQIKPDQYIVQWKVNNGAVTEENIEEPPFTICGSEPEKLYAVRIMSLNEAGRGPMTPWKMVTTEPNPPGVICVQPCKASNGLIISYKDDVSSEKEYEIILESKKTCEKIVQETTTEQCITVSDLTPGDAYRVSVTTVMGDKRSKAAVSDGYTATFPGKVEGLQSTFTEGNIEFYWDLPQVKPDQYIVQWKVDNGAVVEEILEEPPFRICRYKPGQVYAARVLSLNEAGCGPMTGWETFTTVPLPPTDVHVRKDEISPTTTLMVTFKDERDLQKRYIVQAWKDFSDKEPARKVTTKDQIVMLKNLEPGHPYFISVQTVFRGKKSEMAVPLKS